MSSSPRSHLFWGAHSPLSALSGMGLLIMASGRTAFALITALSLLWVYGLTVPVFFASFKILPPKGKIFIQIFLSAFFGSVFVLLIWLFSPFLAMETGFLLTLVPAVCISSGIFSRMEDPDPLKIFTRSLSEAGVLGLLILALALIREPIGYASLSLPGGNRGIVEIFSGGGENSFFPVHIATSSAGALLLLGYSLALFRHLRGLYGNKERNP
ncbi:hypothetical protein AGMMS49928_21160 [Spirochaetia bacterium]|nr:hypothetical protein AGMMS49928_21160 [Spirochaetia bacterium]